jgi:hypothetical protein
VGLEDECLVVLGGRRFRARVQLETREVVIRGDERTVIPFARLASVVADGEWLRLEREGGDVALELGAKEAARWADRIRNPKSRLDKLGVKTGHRVAVVGVDDASFLPELERRGAQTARARAGQSLDLVFVGARTRSDLSRLAEMKTAIRPEGAVWVTWRKGRAELREDDVRAEALRVGLVDVKVVAFSDALSGLKLVIPLAARPKTAKPGAESRASRPAPSRRSRPASRSATQPGAATRKTTRAGRRAKSSRAAPASGGNS